jgi:hypothetical protein
MNQHSATEERCFCAVRVSRRKRRKGNPVPGGITGPPCSWRIYIRESGPPGWGILESETAEYVHESRGALIWEWLRWRGSAAIVIDSPVLSLERMLHKEFNRKGSVQKITGRESQGAWRQDVLIGGKSPLLKLLWLWTSVFKRYSALQIFSLGPVPNTHECSCDSQRKFDVPRSLVMFTDNSPCL